VTKKAFTLIELLIVISIIAILSAVLISVLNPIKQQEKAKDAVIIASMEKVVGSIEAYQNAFAKPPTCLKLTNSELKNVTAASTCADSFAAGTFTLSGVKTPDPTGFHYSVVSGEPYVYAQLFEKKDGAILYACYKSSATEGRIKKAKAVNATTCSTFIN